MTKILFCFTILSDENIFYFCYLCIICKKEEKKNLEGRSSCHGQCYIMARCCLYLFRKYKCDNII